MAQKIGFEFPADDADQWDGFNDAGIEHFSGNPYAAVGREVTQNVVDATDVPPAKISVRLIEVETSSIPAIDELRRALRRCQGAAQNESEKAKIFFDNALTLATRKKIKILQIADSNTTGVAGPCENGTPYYALLKASGQSKKSTDTSIGSFGIGKYAPFVVSGLRTIFISTVWHDGKDWHHYVQGKSILMSHYDRKRTLKGTGYWGVRQKCLPIIGMDNALPEWLRRAKQSKSLLNVKGTTLSILGFDPVPRWHEMLSATIAENFFGAIEKGRLEVDIENKILLKQNTLREILDDNNLRESIKEMKGQPEKFDSSALYLKAISQTNTEVIVERTENQNLGLCELRILVGESLPKKIAILRDGMLITDQLEGLRRFGDFKEFVAVVECHSKKGNALLRMMEPPKHDDFEPDRLPTDSDKRKGRIALKELAQWIRLMLKRHAQDPVSEVTSIDELKEFFADEDTAGTAEGEREENPTGEIIIRARPLNRKANATRYDSASRDGEDDDEGDAGNEDETGSGGKPNESEGGLGGGRGSNRGGGPKNAPARIKLLDVRAIPLSLRKRRIAFTPDFSGEIRIVVQDSGADANVKLQVVSASKGKVSQGLIDKLSVNAGQRLMLDVEFEHDFDGAVRISADAV